MAGRDIQIPLGPDKTGGLGLGVLAEDDTSTQQSLSASSALQPDANDATASLSSLPMIDQAATAEPLTLPEIAQEPAEQDPVAQELADQDPVAQDTTAKPSATFEFPPVGQDAEKPASYVSEALMEDEADEGATGAAGASAAVQGMDEMQMSILALKDSIDQGRELKAREKELQELRDALDADYEELADRDNILANYQTLVAEQDAIIEENTRQRTVQKQELAQVTAAIDSTQDQLDQVREQHSLRMQPLEKDLGRVQASADQAKNDERSRKSELNAAESELRRANEADANTMAIARHQQAEAAYSEARRRSEQTKAQLAEVQQAYDDAKQQAEQAISPLELNLEDLNKQADALKDSIGKLGEEISLARKRRQYCDTVYQYPDETAKMHREVEEAEAAAQSMDEKNSTLRGQLAESKKKAKKAKIAIGIVIAIIVVFIITFIVVSNR